MFSKSSRFQTGQHSAQNTVGMYNEAISTQFPWSTESNGVARTRRSVRLPYVTSDTRKIKKNVRRLKFYKHEVYWHFFLNKCRSPDWATLHNVCLKPWSFWEASHQSHGEMYQMVTQSVPYRYCRFSKRSPSISRQTALQHKAFSPSHLNHYCPCRTIANTPYWYGSHWTARNTLRILAWDTRPTNVSPFVLTSCLLRRTGMPTRHQHLSNRAVVTIYTNPQHLGQLWRTAVRVSSTAHAHTYCLLRINTLRANTWWTRDKLLSLVFVMGTDGVRCEVKETADQKQRLRQCSVADLNWAERNRAEQSRIEQSRAEQNRLEQRIQQSIEGSSEQNREEQNRIEQSKEEKCGAEQNRAEQNKSRAE